MPRSAARCIFGCRPELSRIFAASRFSTTGLVATMAREEARPWMRGHVHGLAEIVLAVVEHDGEARRLVDADLEQQIVVAALGVDARHLLAHAQRRRHRAVWRRERRHDRVPDRLDDRPGLRRHDLLQDVKMLAHDIVGDEIADPLIERGRALEIGEEERKARDLEPLIDIEEIGAIDVAKRLVGQEALCGEERLAFAEQIVEPVAGNP
jgi:hypothetical protein